MIFYLKVNRNERYTFRNLQNWLDGISCYESSKVFIMCDNAVVKEEIQKNVNFNSIDVKFIESDRNDAEMQELVTRIAQKLWHNAAYAHLSTFLHARKNHYNYFWNIDADDTCICLDAKRLFEALRETEQYAKDNGIHAFSLDMHRSRIAGLHWSFGVTFIDNTIDWFNAIRSHYCDEEYLRFSSVLQSNSRQNVDWYFTYLNKCTNYKIENFYFENMKFIHYSDDFFKRPINSGLYHWKDGKLFFPILYYCFGDKKKGQIPICDNCIKLDINITDDEAKMFLSSRSFENEDLSWVNDGFVEANLRKQLDDYNIEL